MSLIARFSVIAAIAFSLASCGGGGGGGSSTPHPSTGTTTPTKPTAPVVPPTPPVTTTAPVVSLMTQLSGPNVAAISVNSGLSGEFPNLIYVTVTVCAPNSTTNCVAIPNVQVDTGSVGLRVLASKVHSLGLPAVTNGSGAALAECAEFADGTSWGSVNYASVNIGTNAGGLTTTQIPIQVIDDSAVVAVNSSGQGTLAAPASSPPSADEPATPEPAACSSGQLVENSAATLGGNGIIGVGYFNQDCGAGCLLASGYSDPYYYNCSAQVCSPDMPQITSPSTGAPVGVALALQVSNPISSFPPPYNNGDIIELPTVPDGGASVANGYLVFGVTAAGTTGNNSLPPGIPLGIDGFGELTVAFNGTTYPTSFIDSGSSVYFFNDTSITACGASSAAPGFYCPASEYTSPSTTITGNGTVVGGLVAFTFKIGNAITLFDSTTSANGYAFDNLGAPNTSISVGTGAFDVGEPFFYGRSVFTVIENNTVGGYAGPFAAVGTAT